MLPGGELLHLGNLINRRMLLHLGWSEIVIITPHRRSPGSFGVKTVTRAWPSGIGVATSDRTVA
eukprot:3051971-Lingulodinium_polyedra.AAC.1